MLLILVELINFLFLRKIGNQGRIQDFKLGGGHLKELRERREARKMLGYFV